MIRLLDLLTGTGGTLAQAGPDVFDGFCYDSRRARPGELFVALVTPTGDGHRHIAEAIAAGVTGVLCQSDMDAPSGVAVIVVPDTGRALLDYAAHLLAQRALPVVAVTGSVGKTSTKEMVAAMLGQRFRVFRSPESYNGRLGLPIALGSLTPRHNLAVLELAADSLGEIGEVAALVRPQVGIITNVGQSHLATFGTQAAIAREKAALLAALRPGGAAVLNADDPLVRSMPVPAGVRRVLVGQSTEAEVQIVAAHVSPAGTQVVLREDGVDHALSTRLLGAHQAYVVALAAAAARALGCSWAEITAGAAQVAPQPGRLSLLQGLNGSQLLDDSYNASPAAVLAALDLLTAWPARRRVFVLGDMAELGSESAALHAAVGQRAAQVVDRLVTVGDLAAGAAQAAREAGLSGDRVVVCHSHQDAISAAARNLDADSVVLIKGSAVARLEEVVRGLMAHPQEAPWRLARQHSAYQSAHLRLPERPAWIELDTQAIADNVRLLQAAIGADVALMAVLKADAYGHGAVRVARTALNNGARWLGVASLNEALVLREAGIMAPILILGYTPPWLTREAIQNDVTVALYDLDLARALSRAAQDVGRTAHAHLKIDTGMGRLGIYPDEVEAFVREVVALPGIELDGVFSHLATADETDLDYAREQVARFRLGLQAARRAGARPGWVHLANSAAALRLPKARYDMVRVGIALYGLSPSDDVPLPEGMRPALSFKCQVAQVKALPAGASVGYGRAFVAERPTYVAVIPVGYADGFRRGPRNWGEVLVQGRRAPVIGNVCMDQTMIDVTDIPGVRAGDEVVLIGMQGDERIAAEDVAARIGTISYEVISALLARVPRIV